MKVRFLGGAGTVTGSRFLVQDGGTRLLVDCGLFQGLKELRLRNWAPFPQNPSHLDGVVLTHAHLDHSGYLPALVRDGFQGPIYATPPTPDLAKILLEDAGRLQEEDADYANRKGFSRHSPARPLFTEKDAVRVSERFRTRPFHESWVAGELEVTFRPAGHILGAASVEIRGPSGTLAVSGDLGRSNDLLMDPPHPPPEVDWLLMESTYGNRSHPGSDPLERLKEAVGPTLAQGGVVLLPSFAVARAQTLLLALHRLFRKGSLPRVPVFLNSPMAIDVATLYRSYPEHHAVDAGELGQAFQEAEFVHTVDESRALNRRRGPMIIVAGAGMLTGGRILHHLKAFGGDRRNALVLAGYQAAGTRGAQLLRGDRRIKIHGQYVDLELEVTPADLFSGHADQEELLAWLDRAPRPPQRIFLVHGEPEPADVLRRRIQERMEVRVEVARDGAEVELSSLEAAGEPRLTGG